MALFSFNYDYPITYYTPQSTPWSDVLKGEPLTKKNAHAYVLALKKHVKKSLKSFLDNPERWNKSDQKGWYSMLWAGEPVEKTGWVFSTLVYDSNASGNSVWDRMVPLGAIWGNDPNVNSAKYSKEELMENYINPHAPAWTKVTLG